MKNLIPILLFSIMFSASAQNWEVIQPGVNSKYYRDIFNPVKTINIYPDSIVTVGSDQFIYLRKGPEHGPLSNDLSYGYPGEYVVANQVSRFGKLVIKSSSGDYRFISYCGDTILLKSQAQINQPWIFAPFRSGRYLEAAVIQMEIGTVLGVSDSIKTIRITSKDSLGQILTFDGWNQITFKISKNHGLLSTPAMRLASLCNDSTGMPVSDPTIYNLVSQKANQQWLGTPDTKLDEIFNLSIGDIFHFNEIETNSNSFHSYLSKKQVIEQVIYKNNYPNGDSIELGLKRMFVDSTTNNSPVSSNTNVNYRHDTITKIIYLEPYRYIDALDTSSSYTSEIYFLSYDTTYNGRNKISVPLPVVGLIGYTSNNVFFLNCSPVGSAGYTSALQVFSKDLGVVQEIIKSPSIMGPYGCRQYSRVLTYFSKNGETWGTPFDTLAVLGFDDQLVERKAIEVFPNPVKIGNTLHFTQLENSKIQIYNLLGNLVGTYQGNEVVVDPAVFQSGIYFWQVEAKDRGSFRGKFLVE